MLASDRIRAQYLAIPEILEKWKFLPKFSWKNGNFSRFFIGKMEILVDFLLEKWQENLLLQ